MSEPAEVGHPAPDGLGERALALWAGTVEDNELEPGELVLLEAACRLVDQVDVMEAAVAEQGPVVKGSRGQPAASPLLREIRAHRLAITRILRQLMAAAPAEEGGERLTASERGRRAAIMRHHGSRAAGADRQGLASTTALDDYRNAFRGDAS
ncbi:hypothetical protein AQF52_4401 [Streptomyces venezuelae]|uniref:hypothetical protein n=1 Tax=Streptomyces gardneri TaxID=66892 RepID=UPI0006E4004A|nr:hypothetical protein [Streptomyces gardneri]ALO09995.1 hypothetical protein AQF52_4401 [Streptomyces venezuelae]QPK47035.1 hypothetical protein H4W23_22085 [Streptomyces gardneri]WRK38452.1 hypothetical protein U0M97_22185 [Streptomyces venezuelae]